MDLGCAPRNIRVGRHVGPFSETPTPKFSIEAALTRSYTESDPCAGFDGVMPDIASRILYYVTWRENGGR